MRWAVIALIALSVIAVVVLALLVWKLWRLVMEFGRVLGRASTEFAEMTATLERTSAELGERRGVD
jgi:hypothetical protein